MTVEKKINQNVKKYNIKIFLFFHLNAPINVYILLQQYNIVKGVFIMFNKKYFFILLLAVVAIGTIASASASDVNQTDSDVAAPIDSVDTTDEIAVSNEDNANDILSNETPADAGTSDDAGNSTPILNSKMVISESGNYLTDKVIKVKLTDLNGTNLANKNIKLDIYSKDKKKNVASVKIKTNANGVATYNWNKNLAAGTYSITATSLDTQANSTKLDTVKVTKKTLKIKAPKIKATYTSGKLFKVRVVDTSGKAVKGIKLKIKIYNGRKVAKTLTKTTNAKGYATYKTTKLKAGNHKVAISSKNAYYNIKAVKSAIKINKKSLSILGDRATGSYWARLAIGAMNKQTKKLVNKLKLTLKVYTGKKYKKFTLVTGYDKILYNSKGIAIFETNKFSVGKHKVKISVVNKNYKGSAKTYIKIPASAKYATKYTFILSNGKGRYV